MNQAARKDWHHVEPLGWRNLCELAQAQSEPDKLGAVIDRINRLLARHEQKATNESKLGRQNKRIAQARRKSLQAPSPSSPMLSEHIHDEG
jgi:hypothetical protein